ncbi:MAG: hypothetical protein D3910_14895 [Candidatus Electrothrix sp. ATG2]|nr:hypothetical protein [Candidatus Electrothrix sp. ATG2]
MNRSNFSSWNLKISNRELREILLLGLLTIIAIFLLHSAFDRAAEKTMINISSLSTISYHEKI